MKSCILLLEWNQNHWNHIESPALGLESLNRNCCTTIESPALGLESYWIVLSASRNILSGYLPLLLFVISCFEAFRSNLSYNKLYSPLHLIWTPSLQPFLRLWTRDWHSSDYWNDLSIVFLLGFRLVWIGSCPSHSSIESLASNTLDISISTPSSELNDHRSEVCWV